MGVAARFAAQFFAFLDEGLLEGDSRKFGGLHDLAPRDLQQPAIYRMGDGFLLDGTVNDDPFKLGRAYGFGCDCRVDRGLEQRFDTRFTDGFAKAPDLGGIAGKFRLVVGLATEVLPDDVLGPAPEHLPDP